MLTLDPVTVWWSGGGPERVVWLGRRWRVSDIPTRLTATSESLPSAFTHAPERTVGWRFQVTDDAGDSVVIDIERESEGWVVARSWT